MAENYVKLEILVKKIVSKHCIFFTVSLSIIIAAKSIKFCIKKLSIPYLTIKFKVYRYHLILFMLKPQLIKWFIVCNPMNNLIMFTYLLWFSANDLQNVKLTIHILLVVIFYLILITYAQMCRYKYKYIHLFVYLFWC